MGSEEKQTKLKVFMHQYPQLEKKSD